MSADLRARVVAANRALVDAGLVVLTFGNASAADRDRGVVAIKPSGIPPMELLPRHVPLLDLDTGAIVSGPARPSSDSPTHLALLRAFGEAGGVVHTHSPFATAWAQALRDLPCLGTTHADHFRGAVPATRPLTSEEIDGDYEDRTGAVIIETFAARGTDPLEVPAALVAGHGPFVWGRSIEEAVANAIALESAAASAFRTLALADVEAIPEELLEKHFVRKHGAAAYYGQPRVTIALGIDFGTESARAILVDCADGSEIGESVHVYENGVIDERLPAPDTDVELEDGWALQDPLDYIRSLQVTVPRLLAETGVAPDSVAGIGIAFTSCTTLPTLADGTPLCVVDDLRREPHSWVKLWKHHAAQPEADRINGVAAERGEPWLARYGGRISSEWFFAKSLQILDEAPHVYDRGERVLEAADWVVWQLTGVESRNACTAGYKAMWSKRDGFPSSSYFAALDPRFENVVDEKMSRNLLPPGANAGGLCERAAGWTGLLPGTPVAVANVDFHASVPAVTVTRPGTLVMIMGTSNGLLLLGNRMTEVEGMCGVVEDGVVPGLFGYEAGQSGLGDVFGWYARHVGISHGELGDEASRLRPGESGLLALDWWNGNRSVLVDADLSGLLVGMTLATTAPEVYRALLEATAFGTRVVIESFERAGLTVDALVACGGLPYRNELLMQVFADVTGCEIAVARSRQTPALGAAMWGAIAGGAFDSIVEASERMAHLRDTTYLPRLEHVAAYDELYGEYLRLHDLFGRGGDDVMRRLRSIRERAA